MPAVFDQRWQCLNEHLDHALDLAEPERIQWLAAVAQADPEMAALVKSLLAAPIANVNFVSIEQERQLTDVVIVDVRRDGYPSVFVQ